MSYVKELRDHARKLPLNNKNRKALLDLADHITSFASRFANTFDPDDLRHLNSLFALSNRLINTLTTHPPGGGQQPVPQEQERLAA
jgi:hypothetical protein